MVTQQEAEELAKMPMYYGAMKTKYKTAAAMKKALKSQVFEL